MVATFQEKMDLLSKKIAEGLADSSVTPISEIGFGMWLFRNLTREEFLFTAEMEARLGEVACNKWMVDLMVATGKYAADADGEYVRPV